MTLWLAAITSALVAVPAWLARALTTGGAGAALAVGTAILWATGWAGAAALLTFFVTSTIVSHLCPDPAAERGDAKGGTRDARQVLANGGAAAAIALLAYQEPQVALWGAVSALAAASADTWATAIGGTAPHPPRHILTRAPLPAGTSGGITLRGTAGGAVGAFVVALATGVAARDSALIAIATIVGFAGMLADSLVGATIQGRFHCPVCNVATERPMHRCGSPTLPVGGWGWLTNDGVNAIATSSAALVGALWAGMIG